jgi:hypothetical protein
MQLYSFLPGDVAEIHHKVHLAFPSVSASSVPEYFKKSSVRLQKVKRRY